jgi:hypothetical protein
MLADNPTKLSASRQGTRRFIALTQDDDAVVPKSGTLVKRELSCLMNVALNARIK